MSGQSDHMRRGKKRKQRQQKPNKSNLESNNGFIVNINKGEKQRIEEWVKLKQDSETGGDLFGLWIDHHTAVVQFVLGPGEKCKRTKTSFFQDTDYLEQAGGYLTTQHGLCNIGQWHSHHKLALSEPSAGDHNTVWSNMPRTGLAKFIVFIANILPHSKVTVNCFLFEIKNGQQLPVKQGCLEELPEESPFRLHELVLQRINNGAESLNDKPIEDKSTPSQRKPPKKGNKRSPVQNSDSNANESRASLMTSEGTPVKDNNMTNQEIAVKSNLNVQNNIDSISRKKCATTASAERSLLTIIGQKNGYFSFDTTNTNNGLQQQQQQQNQRDENKQRLKSVEEVQQQQQNQGHKENGQKLEEKQMQQQQDNKQEWQAPQEEQMQQQQLQQKQENIKQEEEQGKEEPQQYTEKRGKKGGKKGGKKRSKSKKKRTKKGNKDKKSSENSPSNEQPNGIWAYPPCILL